MDVIAVTAPGAVNGPGVDTAWADCRAFHTQRLLVTVVACDVLICCPFSTNNTLKSFFWFSWNGSRGWAQDG